MRILLIILFTIITTISYADVYIVLDKNTNEVKGTADINKISVPDWEERYVLVPAGEVYRGKKASELKYENGVLRHATKEEIEQATPKVKTEREIILEKLGLQESDLVKIKALK